jgi:fucose permease
MAAGVLLLVVGSQPAVTIAGALLMGILGSLLLVMVQATLADHHGERRAVALTEANVGAAVAGMMAPLAIGFFQRIGLGWRWALIVPVVLVAVAALRAWHEPVPEASGSSHPAGDKGAALPRLFWVYWVVLLLVVSAEWCVIFWGADFLENAVGLTKVLAATLLTLFWLAYVVGRAAGSRLARRLPAARLLLASLVVGLVTFPLLWLGAPALLNVAGLFLVGLAFANLFPLTLSVAVGTAPGQANAASARVSLGAGLAILTVPLILGGFADRVGIFDAYGLVAILLVVAILVTWLAGRLTTQLTR